MIERKTEELKKVTIKDFGVNTGGRCGAGGAADFRKNLQEAD